MRTAAVHLHLAAFAAHGRAMPLICHDFLQDFDGIVPFDSFQFRDADSVRHGYLPVIVNYLRTSHECAGY